MGGNVFGGAKPIKKENIKPTLARFLEELLEVFPDLESNLDSNLSLLGSAGKVDMSGDLDLCLDEKLLKDLEVWDLNLARVGELYKLFKERAKTASKEQLKKRAILQVIGEKIEDSGSNIKVNTKSTSNGTLFFQYPQYSSRGDELDREVQIDLNVGNPELLEFMYYSDGYPNSNIKGLHRTQLLIALFTNKGLTVGHNYGVKNKETGEILASTPEEITKLLENLYGFEIPDDKTLKNFFKLQDFLEKNLDKQELRNVYGTYLKVLDRTRCDIPSSLENEWLDRQQELGLTGKFLPASSKLSPFKTE